MSKLLSNNQSVMNQNCATLKLIKQAVNYALRIYSCNEISNAIE